LSPKHNWILGFDRPNPAYQVVSQSSVGGDPHTPVRPATRAALDRTVAPNLTSEFLNGPSAVKIERARRLFVGDFVRGRQ
jgi:hypothetical protein